MVLETVLSFLFGLGFVALVFVVATRLSTGRHGGDDARSSRQRLQK
jgi:hypothetical protein